MSIIAEFWNLLWKEKPEPEPESELKLKSTGYIGTMRLESSQVTVTEAAPGPTENDIILEMRQVEHNLDVSKESLHSRYYQTFAETALYVKEIRALENRLEYLGWFLNDLRARRYSEELWSRLSLRQKQCSHLKGGGHASRIPVKDYNVSDHIFPDGGRQIKCLTCGWASRPGDENWNKALEMTVQSTNTTTTSEITMAVSTGTLDKNKPASEEFYAERAADYKLGYQRIKEEMNSTEVRQTRMYTDVDVDELTVAAPPTNTIQDQIVEGMKLPTSDILKSEAEAKAKAKTETLKAIPIILELLNSPTFFEAAKREGYQFDASEVIKMLSTATNWKLNQSPVETTTRRKVPKKASKRRKS